MIGIRRFLLEFAEIVSGIAGLFHIRSIDRLFRVLAILQHIESEHVVGFASLRFLALEICLLCVEIVFRIAHVAHIVARYLARKKICPLRKLAGLPIASCDRTDIPGIVGNPEFNLGIHLDKWDTVSRVVAGRITARICTPTHITCVYWAQ